MQTLPTWTIEAEGFLFRAVNEAIGFRSSLFTSPSQAGLIILRKAGDDALAAACEDFVGRVSR